jgi:uncharacterized membrane-anchored protein YhcB (DUF1043 family)
MMIPQTLESWVIMIVACAVGVLIGQWINNRRKKDTAENELIRRMMGSSQRKRVSKKERLKARKLSK